MNRTLDLTSYNNRHVRITDKHGSVFEGLASCRPSGSGQNGTDLREGLMVGDRFLSENDISVIELIAVHGTAELASEHLLLRRYRMDDALPLYKYLGTDESSYKYSGWNPYASHEMAKETVSRFISCYNDPFFYGWIIEYEGQPAGTIGAYDRDDDSIETGFSIISAFRGRGLAAEALKSVLNYLLENEGFRRVTAWCAADNIASMRTLEKAGMKLIKSEPAGLNVGGKTYDKLIYEIKNTSLE